MRGEISTGKHEKRHPLDWYVDEPWVADQLALALGDFAFEWERDLAVWDPSCGFGNTLQAAWSRGIRTIGSDVVDNFAWSEFETDRELPRPKFFKADFLEVEEAPEPCSFVFNSPYSYKKRIAERFVRKALKLSSKNVAAVVPSKWLTAQIRFDLFTEFPPQAVLPLCQRPSMPPGDKISALGSRAFKGGSGDYCWIVWDVTQPTAPGETRTIWLPPLDRNSEIRPIWERAHA